MGIVVFEVFVDLRCQVVHTLGGLIDGGLEIYAVIQPKMEILVWTCEMQFASLKEDSCVSLLLIVCRLISRNFLSYSL
ncbi:MAG: hypothetical protein MRZ71_05985 [Bacteroidales bacterium]|nr:hypothetical protein [Bacteroidales bacterium]